MALAGPDYRAANDGARARLQSVIEVCDRGAFGQVGPAILGHIAFWDGYYAARWEARIGGDVEAHRALGPLVDSINAAGWPIWSALALADAAALATAAANRIDALVAGLSPELIAEVEAQGRHRLLERALHRNEHLDELEEHLSAEGRRHGATTP